MKVYLHRDCVGDLIIREKSSTFLYDPQWMKEGFSLSPHLPIAIREHHVTGLHGIFTDASPDRWGRKLIERKVGRTRATEESYLLGVSDVLRQGALRFSLDGGKTFESKENVIPPVSSLPKFKRLTELIMKGEEHDYSELISNASLGGARAKIIVVDNNKQLIAKVPQINDQNDVEGWEFVCLKLAEKSGISASACSLHGDRGNHTLLLERFDRNGEKRLHYMSAMTLLDLKDGAQSSYIDLAFEIATHIGVDCLPELYKRMLLNIMVSNTDDHLRNHGFLYQDGGWRLSPVFDVTIGNRPYGSPHALRVNDEDSDTFETTLAVSEHFGLSREKAIKALSDIIDAVSQWRAVATKAGLLNLGEMEASFFLQEAKDALKAFTSK